MEIHLSCAVCFECFDEHLRTPQILLCGHTFCRVCILKLEKCVFRCSSEKFQVVGSNLALLDVLRGFHALPAPLYSEVLHYPASPVSDQTLRRQLTWFLDSLFVFPFVLLSIMVDYCVIPSMHSEKKPTKLLLEREGKTECIQRAATKKQPVIVYQWSGHEKVTLCADSCWSCRKYYFQRCRNILRRDRSECFGTMSHSCFRPESEGDQNIVSIKLVSVNSPAGVVRRLLLSGSLTVKTLRTRVALMNCMGTEKWMLLSVEDENKTLASLLVGKILNSPFHKYTCHLLCFTYI